MGDLQNSGSSVLRGVIDTIVTVGLTSDLDSAEAVGALGAVRTYDWINRLHWRDWDEVTRPMPTGDVVALVKALTFAEREFRWIGGSVSAVIWVFRELERRDWDLARDVADWIMPRTINPWVPFGTMRARARTYDEYHQELAARAALRTQHLIDEEICRTRAEARRRQRAVEYAAQMERQARASAFRRDLLARLATLDPVARLEHLATDDNHPVDYYPTDFAAVEPDAIRHLAPSTRKQLVARIGKRRRRERDPWRQLHRQIALLKGLERSE